MGDPEKTEKAYNSAKRRYVQKVGLLLKEIDDLDKNRLKAQQAQKRKTKMRERIQKEELGPCSRKDRPLLGSKRSR